MKKEIIYVFKINNTEVERVTWDINTDDVDMIKGCLAYTKGVDVDDIDFEKIEIHNPELGDTFVRADGSLMYKRTYSASPIYVRGIQPALDINHEELFYQFLDLIHKKDIDNAITFY